MKLLSVLTKVHQRRALELQSVLIKLQALQSFYHLVCTVKMKSINLVSHRIVEKDGLSYRIGGH